MKQESHVLRGEIRLSVGELVVYEILEKIVQGWREAGGIERLRVDVAIDVLGILEKFVSVLAQP